MRVRLGNTDVLSVTDHVGKPLVVAIAALDSVAAKQDERKDFALRIAITAFLSDRELSTIVTKILNSGNIALCAERSVCIRVRSTQSCSILNTDIARLANIDNRPLAVDTLIDHLTIESALLLAFVAGFTVETGSSGNDAQDGESEDGGREELHDGLELAEIDHRKLRTWWEGCREEDGKRDATKRLHDMKLLGVADLK